jgi:hypothetical protein
MSIRKGDDDMAVATPKLPLTPDERLAFRRAKVRLATIADMGTEALSSILNCPAERAKYLRAVAIFQRIPSIGPRTAQWVVDLGYYALEEIKGESGADLINRLEQLYGYWIDPCAEDALRCVVYHANHPQSEKTWFDFTTERKTYRQQFGYPQTRPERAWHE